jgi:tRNA(adenine34) deaminase
MTADLPKDERFMAEALKEAQKAYDIDEVPVGAVIVSNNMIIARAYNRTQQLKDVTAHAEMQAFTSAAESLGSKYLKDCTMYVTLEPCVMCAGASYWTQISRIVYGAKDPKMGYRRIDYPVMHPKTVIEGGVLEDKCGELLRRFFELKRKMP